MLGSSYAYFYVRTGKSSDLRDNFRVCDQKHTPKSRECALNKRHYRTERLVRIVVEPLVLVSFLTFHEKKKGKENIQVACKELLDVPLIFLQKCSITMDNHMQVHGLCSYSFSIIMNSINGRESCSLAITP